MAKKVFISYSHADAAFVERLHKHLAQLKRDGTISEWYDREIHAGGRLHDEIERELESANIFLACASPDYIASYSCYERELARALDRERLGELAIIPVVFEPCDWQSTPLGEFKALPEDGKPVAEFTNPNVALLQVARELRRLAEQPEEPAATAFTSETVEPRPGPAPARYRVRREFDDLHKRDFAEQAFSEIYRFFEASVSELKSIPDVQARLSALGADQFSCTVINRGISRGFETIHVRRGGHWAPINFFFGERNETNSSHGGFGIEADDYQLSLRPTMFSHRGSSEESLTPKAAAQLMWDTLLEKVGIGYA